jgi:hypothetical protein
LIFEEVRMIDYQAKLRLLLRCQLMALPNGAELYRKALPQLGNRYLDVPKDVWGKCERDKCSVVLWCLHWANTVEGHDFWARIHYKLEGMIMDKGTIWLTPPLPTFIEVDDEE